MRVCLFGPTEGADGDVTRQTIINLECDGSVMLL